MPLKKMIGKKILIIEDDTFLVKMYLERLQDEGYMVVVASNGEEGLQRVTTEQPDLILLDMVLPIMNGFDFLKNFKTLPNIKKIPILILSNLGQDQDIAQAKELGAVDYLVKTHYPLKNVVEKIKHYLAN